MPLGAGAFSGPGRHFPPSRPGPGGDRSPQPRCASNGITRVRRRITPCQLSAGSFLSRRQRGRVDSDQAIAQRGATRAVTAPRAASPGRRSAARALRPGPGCARARAARAKVERGSVRAYDESPRTQDTTGRKGRQGREGRHKTSRQGRQGREANIYVNARTQRQRQGDVRHFGGKHEGFGSFPSSSGGGRPSSVAKNRLSVVLAPLGLLLTIDSFAALATRSNAFPSRPPRPWRPVVTLFLSALRVLGDP
jgi:hypothetical protein